MTDLTNKVNNLNKKDINDLKTNYKTLATSNFIVEVNASLFLYSIDLAVKYIKKQYNEENIDWKCIAVLLIKKLIDQNKLNKVEDINVFIDKFFQYKKSQYENYKSKIAQYSNKFYTYYPFLIEFMNSLKL
jgi:hypothetical protein